MEPATHPTVHHDVETSLVAHIPEEHILEEACSEITQSYFRTLEEIRRSLESNDEIYASKISGLASAIKLLEDQVGVDLESTNTLELQVKKLEGFNEQYRRKFLDVKSVHADIMASGSLLLDRMKEENMQLKGQIRALSVSLQKALSENRKLEAKITDDAKLYAQCIEIQTDIEQKLYEFSARLTAADELCQDHAGSMDSNILSPQCSVQNLQEELGSAIMLEDDEDKVNSTLPATPYNSLQMAESIIVVEAVGTFLIHHLRVFSAFSIWAKTRFPKMAANHPNITVFHTSVPQVLWNHFIGVVDLLMHGKRSHVSASVVVCVTCILGITISNLCKPHWQSTIVQRVAVPLPYSIGDGFAVANFDLKRI